jgi:hypothetical protein
MPHTIVLTDRHGEPLAGAPTGKSDAADIDGLVTDAIGFVLNTRSQWSNGEPHGYRVLDDQGRLVKAYASRP